MFYIIGSSIIDLYAYLKKPPVLGDSNPSAMEMTYGGVGRNIAVDLSNAGENPFFITAFGDDGFAKGLKEDLKEKGLDLRYSRSFENCSSAVYLAVMNKDDLFLGSVDTSVMDRLDVEALEELKEVVQEEDYLFFDANLKEDVIAFLCEEFKGIKVVDALSANKVIKLRPFADKIDVMKFNALEAKAFWGNDFSSKADILSFLKMTGKKNGEVLLTGRDHCYLKDKDGIALYRHDACREHPVNVSGAGDALLAHYIFGKSRNLSRDECIANALTASVLTVDEKETTITLNEMRLKEEKTKIHISKEILEDIKR